MTKVAILSDYDLRPRAIGGSTIVRYMIDALAHAGCEPSIWFAPHTDTANLADFDSSPVNVVTLPITPPQSAFPLRTAAPVLFVDGHVGRFNVQQHLQRNPNFYAEPTSERAWYK